MKHFNLNKEHNSHTAQQPEIQQVDRSKNCTAGDPSECKPTAKIKLHMKHYRSQKKVPSKLNDCAHCVLPKRLFGQ